MAMDAMKYLKTHYKRTINPQRRMAQNKKGKLVRIPKHRWPTLGHVCPVCDEFSNYKSFYQVNEVSMCETCALIVLAFDGIIPHDSISYHITREAVPTRWERIKAFFGVGGKHIGGFIG